MEEERDKSLNEEFKFLLFSFPKAFVGAFSGTGTQTTATSSVVGADEKNEAMGR